MDSRCIPLFSRHYLQKNREGGNVTLDNKNNIIYYCITMENKLPHDIEYNPSIYPIYKEMGQDKFASDKTIYRFREHIEDAINHGYRVRLAVNNDVDQGFAIKMQTVLALSGITVEVFRVPDRGIGETKEGSRGGKRRRTRKTRRRKTASRRRRGRKHKKTRTRTRNAF